MPVPDVPSHGGETAVAGLAHNGPLRFAGGGGRGRESGAQAVAAKGTRVKTQRFDVPFHHDRDAFPRQPLRQEVAMTVHHAKEGAALDVRRRFPSLERPQGAGRLFPALRNPDGPSLRFLVGLRAPDPHNQPVARFLDIGDIKGHQLGAAKRPAEAEQQQRAIALAEQAIRQLGQDLLQVVGQHGSLALRADPEFPAQPGEKLFHRPGARGRVETGLLMQLTHGRQAALERVPFPLLVFGEIRAVQNHRLRCGRQRDERMALAPGSKFLPIVLVRAQGGSGPRGAKTGLRLDEETVKRATGGGRQRRIRAHFRGMESRRKVHVFRCHRQHYLACLIFLDHERDVAKVTDDSRGVVLGKINMAAQSHRSDPRILGRRTLQRDHRHLARLLRPGLAVLDVGCGTRSHYLGNRKSCRA